MTQCKAPDELEELIEGIVTICKEGVSEEEKEEVEAVQGVIGTSGAVVSGGLAAISATSAADPGALSVVVLMKMLQYIRYMKVNYPSKVIYMLKNQEESPISFNFGPKMPASLKKEFTNYTIPANFAEYELHSSFLVSYWTSITSLAILLMVSYLFGVFEGIARRRASMSWNHFFYRLRVLLKWNLIVLVFCINYDGIVLFSSL